jgi:hypothetical protein
MMNTPNESLENRKVVKSGKVWYKIQDIGPTKKLHFNSNLFAKAKLNEKTNSVALSPQANYTD